MGLEDTRCEPGVSVVRSLPVPQQLAHAAFILYTASFVTVPVAEINDDDDDDAMQVQVRVRFVTLPYRRRSLGRGPHPRIVYG